MSLITSLKAVSNDTAAVRGLKVWPRPSPHNSSASTREPQDRQAEGLDDMFSVRRPGASDRLACSLSWDQQHRFDDLNRMSCELGHRALERPRHGAALARHWHDRSPALLPSAKAAVTCGSSSTPSMPKSRAVSPEEGRTCHTCKVR